MTRQFTELFCSHSSLVKVSRPETRQGKCHGYPINKLPQFGGPLHCADGTKQASRVRTYAFITNMTNEDGGSFESTSRCHLWVQSCTICTHVVSLVQTCLQCRYAQGQTLVTVHMRIGTQRTIHCTDYLLVQSIPKLQEACCICSQLLIRFQETTGPSTACWNLPCTLNVQKL